jgi:hypothetical protein
MKKKFYEEFVNIEKMKEVIRTRVNSSAPVNDRLTHQIVKLRKESAVRMMISMFKTIINSGIRSTK